MNIKTLIAGKPLPLATCTLSKEAVDLYRDATGDNSSLHQEDASLVPPTAVAALAIKHLLDSLNLPDGTVHVGQELSLQQATATDQKLVCHAQIAQSTEKRGWHFVSVAFQIHGRDEKPSVSGLSTLLIPAE